MISSSFNVVPTLVGLKRARDAFPLEAPCDKENAAHKCSLAFILSADQQQHHHQHQQQMKPVPRLPSLSSLSLVKSATLPSSPWGTPQKPMAPRHEPALHPQAKFARRSNPALVVPLPSVYQLAAAQSAFTANANAAAVPIKKGSKYCMVEGCMSRAKHARRCWKHGGSVKCKVPDCSNRAKTKGVCWSHGGGTTCAFDGCSTISVSNGVCWAHGGGKRCAMDGCARPAYERTEHLCTLHFEEKQYISRLRSLEPRGVAALHDRL